MRIACVGGGPAGLFFALLLARTSRHEVTVFDRDPEDSTYGFGVVLSRWSSARLRSAAPDVIDEILTQGVQWRSVEVRASGDVAKSHGHDFGAVDRKAMLRSLRTHALKAGVRIYPRWRVAALGALDGYDLVVGADGAGSGVRQQLAAQFRPHVRSGTSRYVWFGVPRPFECMTFLLADGPHGPIGAHVYPYSRTASTFLVEAPEHVFTRAGLGVVDSAPPGWTDPRALDYCQKVFDRELAGAPLIGNGSRVQSFSEIRNDSWSTGRVVLLGDAAHTAHFSVGSGTSLAMEDAAELASCLGRFARVPDAFAAYEAARKPATANVQAAAWASSQFWERLDHEVGRDAGQILLRLLTRTGQSDLELLRKVDPLLPVANEDLRPEAPRAEFTWASAVDGPSASNGHARAGLVQAHEIEALGATPEAATRYSALALVLNGHESLTAVDRVAADVARLRSCAGAVPVGIYCNVRSDASVLAGYARRASFAAALASVAKLDFVAVGCADARQPSPTAQMMLCEFVTAELQLPAVYACSRARLSHGLTHVKTDRAAQIWLLQGDA